MKGIIWTSFAVAALGLGTLAVVAQGQGKVVQGQEGLLFGAKTSSWAKLDAKGTVQEAGVTIPLSGIEQAPLPAAGAVMRSDDGRHIPASPPARGRGQTP